MAQQLDPTTDNTESGLCGKRIGRDVITGKVRYCGRPRDHTGLFCVSAEAIEAVKNKQSKPNRR